MQFQHTIALVVACWQVCWQVCWLEQQVEPLLGLLQSAVSCQQTCFADNSTTSAIVSLSPCQQPCWSAIGVQACVRDCLPACLCVCLPVCSSACLSARLSACLSACLPFYLLACLHVFPAACLPACVALLFHGQTALMLNHGQSALMLDRSHGCRALVQAPYKNQLEGLLLNNVMPCFDSPFGHLRAKACWVAGQYAEIEFRDGGGRGPVFGSLFQKVVNAFQDPDLPVSRALSPAHSATCSSMALPGGSLSSGCTGSMLSVHAS